MMAPVPRDPRRVSKLCAEPWRSGAPSVRNIPRAWKDSWNVPCWVLRRAAWSGK
ncbi:unnamed protein product [Chondrus crispus]|uniref:Uncharacterized protein n=1 Tax=Chondrus crispus TaxID=2769 RepID=R7QNQ0_CHOCR|nr:unnamed protein product [Chondrus crispus]CDF39101.1 unnamed protein product [Chondrus crispus]|eukprot:XP_005719012.1 unnamed protein product [Chondrus crispus]